MNRKEPLADDLTVARVIAGAVRKVVGVAALSRGHFAEVATYGPGETLRGVAVAHSEGALVCDIRVIVKYPEVTDLLNLANRVRRAVREALEVFGEPIERIDIAIDDLIVGGEALS